LRQGLRHSSVAFAALRRSLGSDDTTTGLDPVQSGRRRRRPETIHSRKAVAMYIGVGTVVLVLLVVIVVMMMRGRRV
jgi:hypothetical protein